MRTWVKYFFCCHFFFLSLGLNASIKGAQKLFFFDQEVLSEKIAKNWFDYYTKSGRTQFLAHLKRGDQFKDFVEFIFISKGLPKELYYLGLIESGYDLVAKSNKGASGVWQFILGTAKRYGLEVSESVDERLHLIKSTEAAADYLSDLFNIFHDWSLAMAAYNSGEYRVLDAIRKGNTRSFKDLCSKELLPNETCNYVTKIWVASQLDFRSREFGLDRTPATSEFNISFRSIGLPISIKKNEVKYVLGISWDEVLESNQDISKDIIPASKGRPYKLYLPFKKYLFVQGFMKEKILSIVKNPKPLRQHGLPDVKMGDHILVSRKKSGSVEVHHLASNRIVVLKNSKCWIQVISATYNLKSSLMIL